MPGNPERDWGRPSWPTGPGNGKNPKTVRDSQDGKGCPFLLLVMAGILVVPGMLQVLGLSVLVFA